MNDAWAFHPVKPRKDRIRKPREWGFYLLTLLYIGVGLTIMYFALEYANGYR